MKLQSGESVTIDVLGTMRQTAVGIAAWGFRSLVIGLVLAILPVVLFVLPVVLMYRDPSADYTWLIQTFFYAAPWSCAFYMAFACNWHSRRYWKQQGMDLSQWREAHGGRLHTTLKNLAYMFGSIPLSYVIEVLFILAYAHSPLTGATKIVVGFALFPFASYAPIILLFLKRRNWSESLPNAYAI